MQNVVQSNSIVGDSLLVVIQGENSQKILLMNNESTSKLYEKQTLASAFCLNTSSQVERISLAVIDSTHFKGKR